MATFKVTDIIKITSKTDQDVAFRPYKQNFTYVLEGRGILEMRVGEPEKALYYYKSILPYADVEMIDDFDKDSYTITANITNGTASGDTEIDKDGEAVVTITPDENYILPTSIEVTGATAQYESSTGVVSLSEPTANVTITCVCEQEPTPPQGYEINTSVTNGTYSGDTTIAQDGTATVKITADAGYTLPSSITVENATSNWDSSNGEISLSAPTGNVTISVVCES